MKCLDTYALIEIHNNNPKFSNYINEEITISNITFTEFYSLILRDYNEKTADYLLNKFRSYLRDVDIKTLIKAVKYRYENKKQNLSFFDCVGYVFALENNMKFVTGDKEFQNKENVEFIKC